MFSANSINKFQGKYTSSIPSILPLMTNGGSIFIPNSRTLFKKSVQLVTHYSPRFISTKIVSSSSTDESKFNFNAYRLLKINSINKALEKQFSERTLEAPRSNEETKLVRRIQWN